jgi:hypothetical protein
MRNIFQRKEISYGRINGTSTSFGTFLVVSFKFDGNLIETPHFKRKIVAGRSNPKLRV